MRIFDSATELHEQHAAGVRSEREIVAAVHEQIAAREPEVQAWQCLAERPEHDDVRGSLSGVPVGIKDIFDTADMPTECGSTIYSGRRPNRDAWCVARLRDAGATIVGKTVTTEFAYFGPGKTRNPHDPGRTPGGSSSGSAAAVAAGMVPVAIGSQTAGSTTRPASFCGIAALAVGHGRFPADGMSALAPGLDTLGLFARDVVDLRLLYDALRGRRQDGQPRKPLAALRILVSDGTRFGPVSAEMRAALHRVWACLAEAGVSCSGLPEHPWLRRLGRDHVTVMAVQAARSLAFTEPRAEELSEPLRELLEHGRRTGNAEYHAAMATRPLARAAMLRMLRGYDAILLPAALDVAPVGLQHTGDPALSRPWHLLGMPALTLPGQRNPAGLPLGMQLVAAPGTESALLDTAQACAPFVLT